MKRGSFNNLQDLLGDHHAETKDDFDESDDGSGNKRAAPVARVVLVMNQLPLKAVESDAPGAIAGHEFSLDAEALLSQITPGLPEPFTALYVGQLPKGVEVDPLEQDAVERQLRQRFNCVPVFLSRELKDRFYTGMCKGVMWPLFHYVLPLLPTSGGRFDPSLWQAYIAVNRKFVDAVVAAIDPARDFVWANDYHLLAFPTLLRKHFHAVRCGFFLHSPFPSSEIFRAFPMREALLRGLLNADLIGFHTFDYARHFLSCCSRILGLEFESKRGNIELEVLGRRVCVKILPTGIEPQRLTDLVSSAACTARCKELAERFRGRTVIVGVDDLDTFKGLDFKLEAFESLLETHGELVGKVIMVQVVNPARSESSDIAELRAHVHGIVERINKRFTSDAGPSLEFWETGCSSLERAALYAIADVCVLTSIRDGLNLHPYEYVVCHEAARHAVCGGAVLSGTMGGAVGPSTVVLSEFAGCSPSLSGALRVNPWSTEEVADGTYRALMMAHDERQWRHDNNYRYVSRHSVAHWARSFVTTLIKITEELTQKRSYGLGFGLTFRVVTVDPHFKRLDVREAVDAYSRAGHRAILLDYDGTLTTQRGCSVDVAPSPKVMDALTKLAADPCNHVCIVSGRGRTILNEWFGGIPRLALAAEHGYFRRLSNDGDWEVGTASGATNDTNDWRTVARPILESYTESTDGSYVQDKESSIVWHFRDADPDFGSWQAKELVEHLEGLLVGAPVEVAGGSTTVEVKPKGMSKGVAVEKLLGSFEQRAGAPLGWVLCIGDDRSDEQMFATLSEIARDREQPLSVFACTVGQKPSQAKYYVNDSQEVLELLTALVAKDASTIDSPVGEQQQR